MNQVVTRVRYTSLSALALMAGMPALGCNALDEPAPEGGRRLVPTDERPSVQADSPPPPLSGGTLLVTKSGSRALIADEARDRLSVVDLDTNSLLAEVNFEVGSEPGRIVESADGSIHVVLRRSGAVATVSPKDWSIVRQSNVCAAPRGLAYDPVGDQLYVACVSGRLVTLSSSGEVTRSVQLPNDLRDVVVERGNVWVSRFRSAEVLRLDAQGTIAERLSPPKLARSRIAADGFTQTQALFEPTVGWRLQANPRGGVALVHQRASTEEISLAPAPNGGTAYGSVGGSCTGIQRASVTTFDTGGQIKSGPDVPLSLPVDVAVRSDGLALVVGAGRADFGAPVSTFAQSGTGGFSAPVPVSDSSAPVISTVDVASPGECNFDEPVFVGADVSGPEQYMVSVALHPSRSDRYLVQTREPAQLLIVSSSLAPTAIPLGGESVADTGFDLFHRNAEAGLSCASCHPDGTDDGHVWNFEGQGLRRTQPVDVGLEGTAPFHWDGSLPDVSDLMGEVFVNRMGGVHQSTERLSTLTDWLFDLRAPAPELPGDDAMVFRGRRLFESLEVGCADCHRGQGFTDNNSYDVGTGKPGEKFQVPSLVGIGTRSRLIHNGCVGSLRERFELECAGGDRHGKISQLEPVQVDDLIAYLQTL